MLAGALLAVALLLGGTVAVAAALRVRRRYRYGTYSVVRLHTKDGVFLETYSTSASEDDDDDDDGGTRRSLCRAPPPDRASAGAALRRARGAL